MRERPHLVERDIAAQFARDRRECGVLEAARRDPVGERGRVEVDVERVPVSRDPARDVDADRRDLPRGSLQPHASEPFDAACRQSERGERPDQRLLEVAHVLLDVLAVPPQVEDGVADELARPVERRPAAAVALDDLDLRALGHVELVLAGSPPERHHRRVLQEDHGVRDRALRDCAGQRALEVPRFAVGNQAEVEGVGAARHVFQPSLRPYTALYIWATVALYISDRGGCMIRLRRLLLALLAASFLAATAVSVSGAETGPAFRDESEWPVSVEAEDSPAAFEGAIVNRSFGRGGPGAEGPSAASGKRAKSNPELNTSFEGVNLFQHRYADNQNQLTIEPPDQGLCVGNGFVFEAVNDAINVYNESGQSVLPPDSNVAPVPHVNGSVTLSKFFGYPPAINRGAGNVRGPIVTDPSCYFDQPTQRWFLVVLTLDAFANGQTKGSNHFDIAVSNGPSPVPLSNWTIMKVPVQNDGTNGTPNHHCNPADNPRAGNQPTNPMACIADYPHIGADVNGFYITANEYDFYGDEFQSSNIYAFSKRGLEAGDAGHVLLETKNAVHGQPGFTVWPANSPPSQYENGGGGTEYFLSSNAADEATCPTGCTGPRTSNELVVWSLSNTGSLDSASPAVQLHNKVLTVGQ